MEEKIKKESTILEKLTEAYIIILIILFPLCVDSTGFFRILECKYRYFLIIATSYLAICILTFIYFCIFEKINYFKGKKLSKIQIAVIVFWIVNIISGLISPYFNKYNLFIGVGRGEGLINISLYCLTFLFITLFGKFKKRYVLYFSISSILISFIAVLQYIGFNPFNMYQDGIGTHNVSFMGTIGNIDFISAIFCILLTVSFTAFVFLDDNKYIKIIHLISITLGAFIFEILDVSSGAVAFILGIALISPFIITDNKRLSKALIAGGVILLGYAINIIINPEYHYNTQTLKLYFQFNYIAGMLIILTLIFIGLAYLFNKIKFEIKNKKKLIKIIYIVMFIIVLIAICTIYFYDFNISILSELHEILHGNFSDDFGTYRIFLWKRSLSLVKDYPLIGTGPDTFAIRFMDRYTEDVIALGELSINDTAANVYITMLVNIGAIGLISYLIFIILQLIYGIKKTNGYSKVLLLSMMCFLIQDFFNLWVVIVTPLFWALMAIHYISLREIKDNQRNLK